MISKLTETVVVISIVFILPLALAQSSENYKAKPVVISPGAANITSTSYRVDISIEDVIGETNTSTYKACIGVVCSRDPQLNVPEDSITTLIAPGATRVVGNFTIQSIGVAPVLDINYSISGGNIPASWVSFTPSPNISLLAVGDSMSINVTLSVPSSASLGEYWTIINVVTSNDATDWLWLNATVSGLSITLEAGGPYSTFSFPTIILTGNVSIGDTAVSDGTVSVNITKGGIQQASNSVATSSQGKYFTTFNTLGVGTYAANASINYSGSFANATDTFDIYSQLTGCTDKTISLSGSALDSQTGQLISSGTAILIIAETGDSKNATVSAGRWSIDFTSCLVTGKRYTLGVKIYEPTGKISWNQLDFVAP